MEATATAFTFAFGDVFSSVVMPIANAIIKLAAPVINI